MNEAAFLARTPAPPGARRRGWGAGLVILLLAAGAAAAAGALRRTVALRDERTAAARDTRRAADALGLAVNGRMTLVRGLRAYVELEWGKPGFTREFDAYAERLLAGSSGVRAAQYVVNDTIKHAFPHAGNEPAVGFDLKHHPDAAETLRDLRAAERSDQIVLSGPLRLVQGGRGLVGRAAARDPDGRLLAIVALVLDLPTLLEEAGLQNPGPMTRALRDDTGRPLAGPDSIFEIPHVQVPLRLLDRNWLIAAVPTAGWFAASRWEIRQVHAVVFLVALLLGAMLWLFLRSRDELRRVREEAARRDAEERFVRLFQLSPDGVVVTRIRDGMIIEVNDAFIALSGWNRSELIGRTTLELRMWLSEADRNRLIERVRTEGQCVGEVVRVRRRDGAELEVEFSARLIPSGDEPLLLSLTRDITERRRLERQLAQAQRMEAIGRLAGGVAHDFNNILTAIVASAETTRMALPAGHPALEESSEILRASGRASDLTRQLLAFARRSVVTPSRVDVNAVAEESGRLLQRIIGEDIRLETSLAPGLPPVLIDPTQLQQVLLNLAVNARDAMPAGGVLSITTAPAAGGVVVEVRDTGIGIPADDQPFIFEPFFTTKEPGKGTGLGLATAYGIVQQAGGRIEVRSDPGQGACFTIRLPATDAPPDEAPAPVAAAGELRRAREGETVQLAEDYPQVRSVTRRTLIGLGYEVLTAIDGVDALRVAAERGRPVNLLVTDVVMPRLSGVDLARQLHERWAGLRVLYLSGYPEDYAALARALESGAVLLPKPYTPAELAAAVRRALDASREPGTVG
jgi:PAS domain S-box-containing protein